MKTSVTPRRILDPTLKSVVILNHRGIETARGGKWAATQVADILRSNSGQLRRLGGDARDRSGRLIGVGKAFASPPSEPYVRFSRIRLSSRWLSTSGMSRSPQPTTG